MPPRNLKESAHVKAQDTQTGSHSNSTKTEQSFEGKSTTKTSERAKSTSTTTNQPPPYSVSTSTQEREMLATPTTSTESLEAVLGTGQRDAGRRETAKAIRLVWDSLSSHLDSAAGMELTRPCCNEIIGKPPFHRKCVKEYAYVIQVLASHL